MLKPGLVVLTVLFTSSGSQEDLAAKERKVLEGKWRVVKFVHSDRETTPGEGEDAVVVVFKGKTIDFDQAATATVIDLDPAADPKCLDFKTSKGSGAFKPDAGYESVYKIESDTLTWAVHIGRGKNRPTGFDKPKDSSGMVMVLKRFKE